MDMTLEKTKIYQELKTRGVSVKILGNLTSLSENCEDILSKVVKAFPNFTNHDIEHSYRVADFMYDLLPQSISDYCDTELIMMLYVAMTHDLGMVDDSFEVKSFEDLEKIRKDHHKRSAKMVEDKSQFEDYIFSIDGIDIRTDIANISKSHNESVKWITENIKKEKNIGRDVVHCQFICYLLRIADLIDFDNQRTPLIVYKLYEKELKKDKYRKSNEEWKKQLSVTNFNHVKNNRKERECNIVFDAKVNSSAVCISLFEYFDYIEKEITEIQTFNPNDEKYKFFINPKVDQHIEKNGFDVKPLIQYVDYLSIANILVGEHLYNKKEEALRELLQNAMDAILLMKEIKKDASYTPTIKISVEKEFLSISDNGIGMTLEDIEQYFLCIGKSFYRSKEYHYDYKPISNYGIGFLSSYLLSNKIVVETVSHQDSNNQIILELNKNDKYVIFSQKHLSVSNHGTTVKLVLSDVLKVFNEIKEIISFIEKNFINPGILIEFYDDTHTVKPIKLNSIDNEYCTFLEDIFLQCDLESTKLNILPCEEFLSEDKILSEDKFFFEDKYVFENRHYVDSEEFKEFDSIDRLKKLIYKDDCINSIIVKGLSWEQEEILIDNSDRCSESELISDRFNEYFDDLQQYDKCVKIYTSNEDFSDVPDDESSVIDEKKSNFWDADENEKNVFWDFAIDKLYPCKKFLITKQVQNIIVNNKDFSFFRKNVKCDAGYFFNNKGFRMDFFVKNVRVDNARISIPFCFSNIALKNLKINVLNNCIPDLSRSKIPEDIAQSIGYAIGRAVHLALLKKCEISGKKMLDNELRLLKQFVSKYYAEKNIFCK
ncbi:MAG: ATP-binding protein [Treponema sp.]|nr:ATP-binding protein [Treponema sp.]